jgi:hypothetical protein
MPIGMPALRYVLLFSYQLSTKRDEADVAAVVQHFHQRLIVERCGQVELFS